MKNMKCMKVVLKFFFMLFMVSRAVT